MAKWIRLCAWCFEEITPGHHKEFGWVYFGNREYHLACYLAKVKSSEQIQEAVEIAFKEKQK